MALTGIRSYQQFLFSNEPVCVFAKKPEKYIEIKVVPGKEVNVPHEQPNIGLVAGLTAEQLCYLVTYVRHNLMGVNKDMTCFYRGF